MSSVIEATADFMADFVKPPPAGMGKASELWIGPPADGGEEGDPVNQTYNPTFELTYWRVGLKTAAEWRARAGLPPKPEWARALKNLATPTVLQGNGSGARACKWTAIDGRDSCRSVDFGSVAC